MEKKVSERRKETARGHSPKSLILFQLMDLRWLDLSEDDGCRVTGNGVRSGDSRTSDSTMALESELKLLLPGNLVDSEA